jgi:hypothetical protein
LQGARPLGLSEKSDYCWDSKARIRVVYDFRQWYKLNGGAVVESCYAMKGGSPQIRREGDDANVIFQLARVSVQEWP